MSLKRIVECVPNFSEGRDRSIIEAIAGAIRSVEGVKLLNVDPGEDFNRTVFTFVGEPESVLEAALTAVRVGVSLINMTRHKGEHPRMGAVDVVPFIPIKGVTMEECVKLSKEFGQRMWDELGVPVFLYARSARDAERVRLPDIRKGEYEALEEKFKSGSFVPDFGDPVFVPKSGTTATGARPILIAYNLNLDTSDKSVASGISGKIRTSGVLKRDDKGGKVIGTDGKPVRVPGRLKEVQAGGMMYNEDIAQVSMNLLDYTLTGMYEAFVAAQEEAAALGARITGSEVVGLVPQEALVQAGAFFMKRDMGSSSEDEEELLNVAIEKLGLNDLYPFASEEKIIESVVKGRGPLASIQIHAFLDELASDSPAPGGGSVAALSGSLGAALMEMVCNLTVGKEKYKDHWEEMRRISADLGVQRRRLTELMDEDTDAFNDVIKAFKMPKETEEQKRARSEAIQTGYRKAIETPMETARCCLDVLKMGIPVSNHGNRNSISDVGVGGDMAVSGFDGAIYNIEINLSSIKDEEYRTDRKTVIAGMVKERERLISEIRETVSSKL